MEILIVFLCDSFEFLVQVRASTLTLAEDCCELDRDELIGFQQVHEPVQEVAWIQILSHETK
jgi:hypothetical protein